MNKNKIFTFFIYISFFLIFNTFFSYYFDRKSATEDVLKESSITANKQNSELIFDSLSLLKTTDLPIVSVLLNNNDGTQITTVGLGSDDACIAFTKDTSKEAVVKGSGFSSNMHEVFSSSFYSVFLQNGKQLKSCLMPRVGPNPAYCVSYNQKRVSLQRCIVENDSITFEKLKPSNPCIVVYNLNGVILPVGTFDPAINLYTPLTAIHSLHDDIDFVPLYPHSSRSKDESLYLIENEYMQLVVSSIGGSLKEINLATRSDTHPNSMIEQIEFDKETLRDAPLSGLFPQMHAFVSSNGIIKNSSPKKGGYYPLIRRGENSISPRFYACSTFDNETDLLESYTLSHLDKSSVTLVSESDPSLKKTFSFSLNSDGSSVPYTFSCSITGSRNVPQYISTGVLEAEIISGASNPTLQYLSVNETEEETHSITLPKDSFSDDSVKRTWVSSSNKFFNIIINPTSPNELGYSASFVPGEVAPSRLGFVNSSRFTIESLPGYIAYVPFSYENGSASFQVYAGPLDEDTLALVDSSLSKKGKNPLFEKVLNVSSIFGFITEPMSWLLLRMLNFFYYITHSWGLSIIFLTLSLRLFLSPLDFWSKKSMAAMQQVAPKQKAIELKFKKDPMRARSELKKLYKEHGGNPLSGCLPTLLQIPIMISMYDLLKTVFKLRGAAFIPGWINDLSTPDTLVTWGFPIPFIGSSLPLLPFLIGIAMFYQMKQTSPKAKANLTEQEQVQKVTGKVMPVVIVAIFFNMPSGLCIYMLLSNVLSLVQGKLMPKTTKQ